MVKSQTSAAGDFSIGPIERKPGGLQARYMKEPREKRTSTPKRCLQQWDRDVNKAVVSLVVHPERIVVPLRTPVCGIRVH